MHFTQLYNIKGRGTTNFEYQSFFFACGVEKGSHDRKHKSLVAIRTSAILPPNLREMTKEKNKEALLYGPDDGELFVQYCNIL